MMRPPSSRSTGQKNSPTLNLGSMPCGCYAKGTPSPRRQGSWGSITPVCSNGWPGTARAGLPRSSPTARWVRPTSLAYPRAAGAVEGAGGPGPVSHRQGRRAVGQGDLWGRVPAEGDVLPPEATEGEKESAQAPGHQYLP